MRRRRQRAQVAHNHERWLVSYADFITLMFAFFVVMFASNQADKGRIQEISQALKEAFENGSVPPFVYSILGGTPNDRGKGSAEMRGPGGEAKRTGEQSTQTPHSVELLVSMKRLSEDLHDEIVSGQIEISLTPRGLVVSLKQAAFFPSGGDEIDAARYEPLEKVATVIKKLPNPVRLEGHTDAVPIHNSRFRSNWDLSASRSIAMLELFERRFGVPRMQMAISGYADTFPVGDNLTEAGRAQNRRVDILIMNKRAAIAMPERVQSVKP